jgi:cytochrome c
VGSDSVVSERMTRKCLAARLPRATAALLLALALAALLGAGCRDREAQRAAAALTGGGFPERGAEAIRRYGCHTCHTIPGIRGADGLVGPPLTGMASRVYIAGMLPNTPENMILWIRHPRQVNERTAMPDMNVTEPDARDIAAYLYTLRQTRLK